VECRAFVLWLTEFQASANRIFIVVLGLEGPVKGPSSPCCFSGRAPMVTGQARRVLGTSVFLPQSPLQRILGHLQMGARDEGGGGGAGDKSFCLFLNKSLYLKRKKIPFFLFSKKHQYTSAKLLIIT